MMPCASEIAQAVHIVVNKRRDLQKFHFMIALNVIMRLFPALCQRLGLGPQTGHPMMSEFFKDKAT